MISFSRSCLRHTARRSSSVVNAISQLTRRIVAAGAALKTHKQERPDEMARTTGTLELRIQDLDRFTDLVEALGHWATWVSEKSKSTGITEAEQRLFDAAVDLDKQ